MQLKTDHYGTKYFLISDAKALGEASVDLFV